MALRYQDFLNKAVDEAIEGATKSYGGRDDKKGQAMLQGALAGLMACRNLSPPQLHALLARAYRVHQQSSRHRTLPERYWRINCFKSEVEWICNVVSVVLVNQGIEPIVEPISSNAIDAAARLTQEPALTN